MELGTPVVLGPESAYRMNHIPVHQPWNRNGSAYHHDGFPSNSGDVIRDASLRPASGTAAYAPLTTSLSSTLNNNNNNNNSIGPQAPNGLPRTASFSPPMSPFRLPPSSSTHHWQQQPLPPPLTPLTPLAPLSQTSTPTYHGSAFGPIGSQAHRHQPQQQQQNQRHTLSSGANGNSSRMNRPPATNGLTHDSSADEMTDASPSLSDGSADDGAVPDTSYRRSHNLHHRQAFAPTTLPSLQSRESGSSGRQNLPASTSARRGGGGARDEFDGPTQLLPRPVTQPTQNNSAGLGGGLPSSLLDQQHQPHQQHQQHPSHHHPGPLQPLPELPTHLGVQEQDGILAAVNARLAQCAFDFVARYQFPIPCTPDMRPVKGPQDREWSEWVHLLRRLATRRRIPARVLYHGQIRQFVTVLENSLEMRHAGRAQSSRPPRDDRNVLQLISAGLQVAQILQDGAAMEFLDHLYVSTDNTIKERTSAEARYHG